MNKNYKGFVMFYGYLPFSVKAKNNVEALKKLQKKAPKNLNDKEQKELLLHVHRLVKADRVIELKKISRSDHSRIRNFYKDLGEAIKNRKRMRLDLASSAILQIEECFKSSEGITTQNAKKKRGGG